MDRDLTFYALIGLGAVILWLIVRGRRARGSLWARVLPVAIAVALAMGLLMHMQGRF
ncbi:MAG: hypothetical protein RIB45_11025 [Marivibrio sp.]|uniref:hypothetical protein n=1 Tax=Marivibrio sp. TaxID=2039719 RepID=UPI0032EB32BF